MGALMKYEFRKTWATKAMVLGVTAVAQLVYLIGLYAAGEDTTAIGIVLLTLCAIAGILLIGIQSVVVLHRDMNTRQGYMLYMTPNSCWKILGAKVIENGLSLLLSGLFFFALAAIDIGLLFARYGTIEQLLNMFQDLLSRFGRAVDLSTPALAALTLSILASWLRVVCTGFLADTVATALLSGKRFNGAVSFLLFLLLSFGASWVERLPVTLAGSIDVTQLMPYYLAEAGIALALAAGMYALTAWIMDRYLSV